MSTALLDKLKIHKPPVPNKEIKISLKPKEATQKLLERLKLSPFGFLCFV